MPSKTLRLEIAKAIQKYRLVKMVPVYSKEELADVVNAWASVIGPEGIAPEHIAELFNFAVIRHGDKFGFGADDLVRCYGTFCDNLKNAVYDEYYKELDAAAGDGLKEKSAKH